jgi:hypothetical protein
VTDDVLLNRLILLLLIGVAPALVPSSRSLEALDRVAESGARVATDGDFKPLADAAIRIDDSSLSVTESSLRIDVAAQPGIVLDRVQIDPSGNVDVDKTAIRVDDAVIRAGAVEVDVVSLTGDGEVTATLFATAPDGSAVSMSDTVWVSSVDGVPVISSTGTQDLALQVADLGLGLGTLTSSEAEQARDEAIGGTAGGAAVEVVLEAPTAGPCNDVCVTGTVAWTDAAGETHPVRQAPVTVLEKNGAVSELITTVTTDDDGVFSAVVDGVDPEGGSRDLFARVTAAGPGFKFVRNAAGSPTQFIESAVRNDVPVGSTISFPFVANNVNDNNTVFSLHNAMVIASEYLASVQSPPFRAVEIVYPATGSFYTAGRVNVLQLDRWDWDVLLHEYGHFVADQLGIHDNPGGPHSGGVNLADMPGRDKDEGVRLAWGEGWPSYFAVSLLKEMDAASLGIANVGDERYQDTEDAAILHDLEVGRTLGEDNEVTVMSTLWDLYDALADGADLVALGDDAVWSTLNQANPTTLSSAYAAFAPVGGVGSDDVNCVFSMMNVAPRLDGPTVSSAGDPGASAFTWRAGNGGINGRNDLFVLEIRDSNGSALLHSSGLLAGTSYTVPANVWRTLASAGKSELDVTVVASELNAPVTGPYRSCAREILRDGTDPLPVPTDAEQLITTLAPARFVDTRGDGQTVDGRYAAEGRRDAGATYEVVFSGRGQVPADARAVVANITAVRPGGSGFVTAFDCLSTPPVASSLNYAADINTGNEIVLGLNSDGAACLTTSTATDVTVDVTGYVAAESNYDAVVPARLLDTRGQSTVDGKSQGGGRIPAGGEIEVQLTGRGSVPSGAVAAVVNVTAIGASDPGFVTAYPCLADLPNASSLNFVPGVNRGNELISPLTDDGALCLAVSAPTHLTVDVVGYVTSREDLGVLTPSRLLDTRPTGVTLDGLAQNEGRRTAGSEYRLQIAGRGGVAGDARSVVVNVTAVAPSGVGYVTVHPCLVDRPVASGLNYTANVTASNEIVAQLDASGGLCLYSSEAAHLLVDATAVVN